MSDCFQFNSEMRNMCYPDPEFHLTIYHAVTNTINSGSRAD